MTNDRVTYNGQEMAAEWPARIENAQNIREYMIDGKAYERVPYGREDGGEAFSGPCHDCGVLLGQYHVELVCDMEECPRCRGQVIGCDCPYEGNESSERGESTDSDHGTASVDWRELFRNVEQEIVGYSVFLETSSGGLIPIESNPQDKDIVGLAVTYTRDNLSPAETQEFANELAHRLSARVGLSVAVLISRRIESFVGYYVSIRR